MYICVIFMAHASAASYFPGKPPSPQEKKNLKKISFGSLSHTRRPGLGQFIGNKIEFKG